MTTRRCNVPGCLRPQLPCGLCEEHRREYVGPEPSHDTRQSTRDTGSPWLRELLNPPGWGGVPDDEPSGFAENVVAPETVKTVKL